MNNGNIIGSNGVASATFFPSFTPQITPVVLGNPTPPETTPPATLDGALAKFQPGNAPTAEDVAKLWAAFGQSANNVTPPNNSAPIQNNAAPNTAASEPAASVDQWAAMFEGFTPTLPEPEYFKDSSALGNALSSSLPQINWAELFANQDSDAVNKTINMYMQQLLVNSVRGAFHSAKSSYEQSAPDTFKKSFEAYRRHKQVQAGSQVPAPAGMNEVARALTTQYINNNPTASAEQVRSVVGTLMGTLSSVLTPKPTQSTPTGTDWSTM